MQLKINSTDKVPTMAGRLLVPTINVLRMQGVRIGIALPESGGFYELTGISKQRTPAGTLEYVLTLGGRMETPTAA